MASPRGHGRQANEFRAEMKAIWQPVNRACGICGQADIDWDGPVNAPDSYELDHVKSVIDFPALEFERGNAQPSHCRCNRRKGRGAIVAGIGATDEAW